MTSRYIISEDQLSAIEIILKLQGITIKGNVLLSEIRNNTHDPQSEYRVGFDEGFEIGKAQCETHHEEMKQSERLKLLGIIASKIRSEFCEDEEGDFWLSNCDFESVIEELEIKFREDV